MRDETETTEPQVAHEACAPKSESPKDVTLAAWTLVQRALNRLNGRPSGARLESLVLDFEGGAVTAKMTFTSPRVYPGC